jgi:hypothetical protein
MLPSPILLTSLPEIGILFVSDPQVNVKVKVKVNLSQCTTGRPMWMWVYGCTYFSATRFG